ncbi:MAG: class F sortase [Catenulispora sp.]|nr:class F sortase [Catenulispora sp.]
MRHPDGKGRWRELSARGVLTASLVSLGACVGIVLVAEGLHTPKPPPSQPLLAAAAPTRVRIPALHVDAPLTGFALDGTSPGTVGTAVIAGPGDLQPVPAGFLSLGALKKGDVVSVDRADKQSAVFTVDAVEASDAHACPETKGYGASARAELRLITCGAGLEKRHGRHSANVVVSAHLTAVRPVPAASGTR